MVGKLSSNAILLLARCGTKGGEKHDNRKLYIASAISLVGIRGTVRVQVQSLKNVRFFVYGSKQQREEDQLCIEVIYDTWWYYMTLACGLRE